MHRRPTVVLFDIDGTLVTCGGAGRRAMERAFREHTEERVAEFPFGGMTDRAIVRQALAAARIALDDALIEQTLERYLAHLEDELPRSTGYAVLDGVWGALEALERAAPRSYSHYAFLDAPDWLDAPTQQRLLRGVLRSARDGARVVTRSVEDACMVERAGLSSRLRRLDDLSERATRADRTRQYRHVNVYEVQA